jgi:hypothetical protein
MSLHHLLQNKQEQIFIQAIDQHFENNEMANLEKSSCQKEIRDDLDHYEKCKNIDVKFYFSFDEDEDSNDVSTIDDSDDYETLIDSQTNSQTYSNKKFSIGNFLNSNGEHVKGEILKIRNETINQSKMFFLQIQNKIKTMNQYYEIQMKNYLNLINSTNANNLKKVNGANCSTLMGK